MKVPIEQQKKVSRGQFGKWVYCLAEHNHRKYPGFFKLHRVSDQTAEAGARIIFKKYLDLGDYFLVKMPEVTAHLMNSMKKEE